MNWFRLLRNKAGKLTFGMSQMAAVGGVGLVIAFTAFQADKKIDQKQHVRSLSSISNAYNYGGMQQTGHEGLTSINVKDALNQVANAEERARIEGARTGGGDFGLSAADNLGSSVGSSFPGAAAQTSDTEGLGMGGNEAADLSTRASISAGGANGMSGAGAAQGASGKVAAAGASGKQLGSASMARASGGGINNTMSTGSRSFGSTSSGSGSSSSSSGGEGYKFSGAMPGGTNPVSLGALDGRGTSGALGGSRNGSSFGNQSRIKASGNELKDISRMSAKVAANASRSTNEGGRPFLSQNVQLSGGMSLENGVEALETGSTDLYAAQLPKLDQTLAKKKQETQDEENERDKARNLLYYELLATIILTVAGIAAIKALMTAGDAFSFLGLGAKACGWIVAGIVMAACLALVAHATRYGIKYKFGLLAGASIGLGLAGAVWALITALQGQHDQLKTTKTDAAGKKTPINYKEKFKKAAIQAGMSSITPVAKVFGEMVHQDVGGDDNKK